MARWTTTAVASTSERGGGGRPGSIAADVSRLTWSNRPRRRNIFASSSSWTGPDGLSRYLQKRRLRFIPPAARSNAGELNLAVAVVGLIKALKPVIIAKISLAGRTRPCFARRGHVWSTARMRAPPKGTASSSSSSCDASARDHVADVDAASGCRHVAIIIRARSRLSRLKLWSISNAFLVLTFVFGRFLPSLVYGNDQGICYE